MAVRHCPECRGPLDSAGDCPKCLLQTAAPENDLHEAERIFRSCLAYHRDDREGFIATACAGNPELLAEVNLLLAGYLEAGGDEAMPTFGDSTSARANWAVGDQESRGANIGPFQLVRLLGEGGMGSVWEAEQHEPVKRSVALKLIKVGMDTREVVARFTRERQTLALMNHPNIAHVFEAGATELGRPYFAMELVEGLPINDYCEQENLGVRKRIALFVMVCGAIEHAHQKGVLHRDLKPSNILVSHDGSPKVIDFGVAKAIQDEPDDGMQTLATQVLGTPAYMSPEQAASDGSDADTRSDVYSLGVILYELLSGSLPFDPERFSSTSAAEIRKILRDEEPPPPSTRIDAGATETGTGTVDPVHQRNVLQGDLDWVVMKAIAKDRERRYSGPADLAADLRRYLDGELVHAVPPTFSYRIGKFVRRHRAAVLAFTALILALATGLAYTLIQNQRVNRALAGESAALREANLTVADLQANNGLNAADRNEVAAASLWFAQSAVTAASDPERVARNQQLQFSWRQRLRHAVRAFDTGEVYINSLEFNPRRPSLLVGIANKLLVQVWDVEDSPRRWGEELGEFPNAAWGPTGDRLAVRIGEELRVFAYPSADLLASTEIDTCNDLSWHPDGEWAASGGADGLLLWNVVTGERIVPPGTMWVERLDFSPDGRALFVQREASTFVLSGRPPFAPLHPAQASSINGRSIFLGGGEQYLLTEVDGSVVVRDTATGIEREHYPGKSLRRAQQRWTSSEGRFIARESEAVIDRHARSTLPDTVSGLADVSAISPDGSILAASGNDQQLRLWSLPDGEPLDQLGDPHTRILTLQFSPDGSLLASAERGAVKLWRVPLPSPMRAIETDQSDPSFAALSDDRTLVAPSGWSREFAKLRRTRVVEIVSGAPVGPELDPNGLIMDATFAQNGSWLAMAVSTTPDRRWRSMDKVPGAGNVQFWDYRRGVRLGDPIPLPSEPRGIALHPDGELLAVSCAGGEGLEIEPDSRQTTLLFDPPDADSRNAAFSNNGRCGYSPDGKVLAVWGPYQTHRLWHRGEKRNLLGPFRHDITVFDLDFHGEVVANTVVTLQHRLEFRETLTGKELGEPLPYTNWPMVGCFDASGTHYLAGGNDNRAQVWDWRRREVAGPPLEHREGVHAAAFLPRPHCVVTAGTQSRLRFWDYRIGRDVAPPWEVPGPVFDLQVSEPANTLVVGGYFGRLELLDLTRVFPAPTLDPEAALRLAELDANAYIDAAGRLQRLSAGEWFRRWKEFRRNHPEFHRLEPTAE